MEDTVSCKEYAISILLPVEPCIVGADNGSQEQCCRTFGGRGNVLSVSKYLSRRFFHWLQNIFEQ
jgi:hypothetical protein